MRRSVSVALNKRFLRSVAVVGVAGIAAGCSSNVARFSDNFYTNSVPTDPPREITSPVYEPYPGDAASDNVDRTYTGSVVRKAAQPVDLREPTVERKPLKSATQNDGSALAPVAVPKNRYEERVDPATTGSIKPDAPAEIIEHKPVDGWTRTGGTQVTLREGETIYNLSRRFGVPAKAIMRANGITDPSTVHAGRKIVIPTYVYSSKAPVSAPDSNPNTASAKSSRGDKYDVPAQKVPVPGRAPKRETAVLPSESVKREDTTKKADTRSQSGTKSSSSSSSYTVASGDTLWGISKMHGVSVAALREANGISDGNIRVGQKLEIPGASSTTNVDNTKTASVEKEPEAPAKKLPSYTPPKKTEKVIEKAEKEVAAASPDQTGASGLRWPVRGRVISEFGERNGSKPNDGIDISVPSGTPVKAAENGIVIYAGDGLKDFGNTILVRHEDGLVTVYGHNSRIKVARGERVRRGQEIALSGMSGTAESPRVHFELRKNSVPINPLGYLK